MTGLPLFDLRPVSLSRTPEHEPFTPKVNDDVLRVITHKSGPMREIVDGATTGREFVLVELVDGRFLRQFKDGHREKATAATTRVMVDDAVRAGLFVEARP